MKKAHTLSPYALKKHGTEKTEKIASLYRSRPLQAYVSCSNEIAYALF